MSPILVFEYVHGYHSTADGLGNLRSLLSRLRQAITDHQARLDGTAEVEIWGDGNARREFMYAGDLADCMVEALRRFDSLPPVMNVGLGTDLTINDYYRVGAEVVGYAGGFRHDLTKPVGMKRKLVDTSLAGQWGWHASTSLQEGMRKAYDYYLGLS